MMGTVSSLQAVGRRSSIIANVSFPRIMIPLSAVATESIAFSASPVMLPLMMAIYGAAPTPAALWLPVAVGRPADGLMSLAVATMVSAPPAVAEVDLQRVGVRFDFDRRSRVVTPVLAHIRRIRATTWGLQDVDLRLEPGAGLALVGPTG